jgi:hypothetical protein
MKSVIIPYAISFMPLVLMLSAWAGASHLRRTRPLHPFALTLLTIVTVVAVVPACSYVYFEFHPVHLPPWESPEVRLLGWMFLLGPLCMLLGLLAFRKEPRWLFWVLELASFWLFGIGVLAAAAY